MHTEETTMSNTIGNGTALDRIRAPRTKSIHRAIDFTSDGTTVGFQIQEDGPDGPTSSTVMVTSSNGAIDVQAVEESLRLGDKTYHIENGSQAPDLDNRWDREDLADFAANPQPPIGILDSLKRCIGGFIGLSAPGAYGLMAAWILMTYFTHLFTAVPYLFLFGPKSSGKSKALELLGLLSFNGKTMERTTLAALSHLTDSLRSTIIWDQAENLLGDLIGILAGGYKRIGATRYIFEKIKGIRRALGFSVYGPKAFGSTKPLNPDLLDRNIQFNMQRTDQPLPDIIGHESEIRACRHACYRFLLTKRPDVQAHYAAIPSTGTRQNEIWRPLEAVLRAADTSDVEISQIKAVFDAATARTKATLSLTEEALFQVLYDQSLEADASGDFVMKPDDIIARMHRILKKSDVPSAQQLGRMINRYGLATSSKPRTRHKTIHYTFNADRVRNLAGIYAETLAIRETISTVPSTTITQHPVIEMEMEDSTCQEKRDFQQWI
jgi:hypothetical protein